ncbi:MAG TPA: PAS domain-containing sensor histidine kinase [Planctomycetes bacterium]|nr:PAS domain-containing sensor histidine kinase [Planctomycetota bacterium]
MSSSNLCTSPHFLRALLDHAAVSVFVHDVRGRFVDVNAHACASVGYSREQLLECNVSDIEQEHQMVFEDHGQGVLDSGEVVRQGVHRHADGSTHAVEVHVSAFEVNGQQLFCAVSRPLIDDAVHQTQSRSDLEQSHTFERDLFQRIFENANEAIAIIDHEGRYLRQNQAHLAMFGFSDEELAGKTPAIHLGPGVFADVGKALADDGEYRGELTSRAKNGVERQIDLSAFAVERGDGLPPVFVGIKRDITKMRQLQREDVDRERMTLEESLRQAQKMEIIGQLAAGVAHDFNNLLTPILSYSDLEVSRPGLPDDTRSALQEICTAAKRGRDLTTRLLAFGRKQRLNLQPLDLGDLVAHTMSMLRRLVPDVIEFAVSIEEGLPAILADAAAVEQVLMNLATNAADSMPDGGILRIAVKQLAVAEDNRLARVLGTAGTFLQLTVADTGHGMEAATLERVFEPFFTTKDADKGTGLGLSIVHGIVRQHDGYITAESEPGHGTQFQVILPPSDEAVVAPEAPKPVPHEAGTATILVVEDEQQVLSLVIKLLMGSGYHVLGASSGLRALEVAREYEGAIDLLLSDVVMPGLNGHELFERLRPERPELSVLFMSGHPRDGLVPQGQLASGVRIIEKPFTAEELDARVREELAMRKA